MLRRPLLSVSLLALAISGHYSQAETADSAIERLEVRADFHQTQLQKLAGSVAILSVEDQQRQNAQHLEDLFASIANLNFTAGASRGRFVQLRGIGERSEFVDTINPSVGLLYDGIDYAGLGAVSMLDLQQVEVFRGPEATRFGANALAGMLNLVSADISRETEGYARLTFANYQSRQLTSAFNTQVTEQWGLRLAADVNKSDGFIRNTHLNRNDTNGIDEQNYRLKNRLQLSDDTVLELIINRHDIDNGYDAFSLNRDRTTLSDEPGKDAQDIWSGTAKLHYRGWQWADSQTQFSRLTASSVYGYDEDWAYDGMHADGYSSTDYYFRQRGMTSLDQRFVSKSNAPMPWVFGLYASRLSIDLTRQYTWFDADFESGFSRDNVALYGETSVELAPALKLTVGGRAERYQADYQSQTYAKTSDYWMWGGKLNLDYALDDRTMLYALVSRGYKVGGVNGEAVEESLNSQLGQEVRSFLLQKTAFSPEYLINTELGVKSVSDDQRLVSRLSMFHMWRQDMQLKAWINEGTKFIGYLDNAASGRNYGLEMDTRYQWNDQVQLQVTGALLSTKMDGFVTKAGEDKSGRDQAQAPRWQYGFGADMQLAEPLTFSLQWNRKAGYYYSDSEDIRAKPVSWLNLALRYQAEKWQLSLWSRNALNSEIGVQGFYFGNDPRDGYSDHLYEQLGEPRRFGVTVAVNF